jgi:hypothetical protein
MLVSNLGWDTGYPNSFHVFSQCLREKNSRKVLPSGYYRCIPNPSQLKITFPFDACVELKTNIINILLGSENSFPY